ncbi:multidrug resistance-associated protein 1-like isoform X1 [Mya arenaria]|uniref:multidrug resistance-associated protein 1-like isoform X1 n=1 Tax=Mya arenaria TaxID=6604 RepID=UPI0022E37880|nr:multidrug resistance-associated protein 1-like isoform X1 [Mya arenaria]
MGQSFDEFCGETKIWDTDILLNSSYPRFTECFQNTLLIWIPCAVVWVSLPFYMRFFLKTDNMALPLSFLSVTKTFVSLVLFLLTCVDLLYSSQNQTTGLNDFTAFFVGGSVNAATFLLVAVLVQMERLRGLTTSGVMFIFWFLTAIASVVPFYTRIEENETDDTFRFSMFCVYFGLVLVQLVLACFVEKQQRRGYQALEKPQCPEATASFPSQLTFNWITSLVVQIYKHGIKDGELWELHPRDQSDSFIPDVLRAWKHELARARQKQKLKERRRAKKDSYHGQHETSFTNRLTSSSEHTPLLASSGGKYGINASTKKEDDKKKENETKKNQASPSLLKVIVKCFGWAILKGWACKLVYDGLQFVSPLVLSLLISYVENKENEPYVWKGYVYAASLFVVAMTQSIFFHQNFHASMTAGMRVKSALIAAVYNKALTMTSEAKQTSTVGEIVNLMSVDCQRLQDLTGYLWMLWSAPVQMILAMVLLWNTLGPSVLAGLGILILLMPVNAVIATKMRKFQVQQMTLKDSRIKLMNEVLNGIKVLKLYAWEPSFEKKILEVRNKELNVIKKAAYLGAVSTFFWSSAPFLVTLATFATYILIDDQNQLDANKAFVSLSLFNILRFPINLLPMIISYVVQCNVSLGRISRFLQNEDIDPNNVIRTDFSDHAMSIENGVFSWSKTGTPTLQDINIEVGDGKLVAVVGQVGAGKSSLVSALLGEMERISGTVKVKGSVAYVAQQAWIQNATVRDNILFGKELDQNKYRQVIEACALEQDLEILQGGDMTEIGEKGINLSGGQKQRVSLARAVYHNADVYLFDDPLSAVDSHVGKHIFNKVVGSKGLLRNKTRILVTHGVHWLPMVDTIVVMIDGRVSEMGSYEELLSHDGAFAQFLKTYLTQEHDDEDDDPEVQQIKSRILERVDSVTSGTDGTEKSGDEDVVARLRKTPAKSTKTSKPPMARSISAMEPEVGKGKWQEEKDPKKTDKLIEAEKAETGNVSWRVYFKYLAAIGAFYSVLILVCFILYQGAANGANIWLQQWTDDKYLQDLNNVNTTEYKDKNYMYLGVYGVFGVGQAVLVLSYAVFAAMRMIHAAGVMHNGMLANILKLPMAFFDTTPLGRIVNRFSRDVETIDNTLPMNFRMFLLTFFGALSSFIVISYTTPLFLVAMIPIAFLYYLIQRFYIPTSRQLKRIESTTRSPIYSHFGESIAGASSIRGYRVEQRFMYESKEKVDKNMVFYFAGIASNRWLGFRLEVLGNLIVLAAAIFAVVKDGNTGGLVGLSISYALQVTGALNFLVRNTSDVETNVVSVERVREYTEEPTEAEWVLHFKRPSSDWPDQGNVRFNNYSTRYRDGLDLVLRGISCDIRGGERVGIVGRTGAGKSSLTVALFRLIEAAGGNIVIDGQRISDLGLHDLRSKLTILPQDPVLFSGTLRMNLDPFDQYTDNQVWVALEHSHLKAFVTGLPDGLEHECGEGGQNLSVGQRQLVCLARTLLRKTKVLILDEATAAVDMETDDLIQNTIREEFRGCTILTIAHRLNTIMDYDKILVLDQGLIKEFDSPENLLADTTTVFYGMARAANLV